MRTYYLPKSVGRAVRRPSRKVIPATDAETMTGMQARYQELIDQLSEAHRDDNVRLVESLSNSIAHSQACMDRLQVRMEGVR